MCYKLLSKQIRVFPGSPRDVSLCLSGFSTCVSWGIELAATTDGYNDETGP